MSYNDQLLRIGRNYPHASTVTAIATTGTIISGTSAADFAAAPSGTSTAKFTGKADFAVIDNLDSTNYTTWTVGSSQQAGGTNAAGRVCFPGGTLVLPLETEGTPIIYGLAHTGNCNVCINWYQSERR